MLPRMMQTAPRLLRAVSLALVLAFGAATDTRAYDRPEGSSGFTQKTLAKAKRHMVVAANPLAAEAGMDMPTLAALLGHSKLNTVMRYAHPQEKHQVEAVKRLEAVNAAKEIAEFEKVPTFSPTVQPIEEENASEESENNASRVN